jgi:hypothetical protein
VRTLGSTVALGVALLAGACGLPLVDGTAQFTDVCNESPQSVVLDGGIWVDGGSVFTKQSFNTTYEYPMGDVVSKIPSKSGVAIQDLTVDSVTLRLLSGVADFSFVDSAAVALSGADGGAPIPMFTYTRDTSSSSPSTVVLYPADTVNLYSLVTSGAIEAQISFTGSPPMVPWTVSVKPCFSATVSVNVGKQ